MGLYREVRTVVGVQSRYYLAAEYHRCGRCNAAVRSTDARLIAQLPDALQGRYPVLTSHRSAIDRAVLGLLRSRTLGNSPTVLRNTIAELHPEDFCLRVQSYLADCWRHQWVGEGSGKGGMVGEETSDWHMKCRIMVRESRAARVVTVHKPVTWQCGPPVRLQAGSPQLPPGGGGLWGPGGSGPLPAVSQPRLVPHYICMWGMSGAACRSSRRPPPQPSGLFSR